MKKGELKILGFADWCNNAAQSDRSSLGEALRSRYDAGNNAHEAYREWTRSS